MKLKKYVQGVMLGTAVTVLAACSSTGGDNAPIDNLNGDAGTSPDGVATKITGAGSDSNFSDSDKTLGDKSGATSGLHGSTMKVGPQIYYFDFNENTLHEADKPSISVQAKYLATHPSAQVRLEGNTDPRGSKEYNIALGERRNHAVETILKEEGASAHQINAVSYGSERRASEGTTDVDYALDRRVKLSYTKK
jgi:peptidoglycan-associated lipoprotein